MADKDSKDVKSTVKKKDDNIKISVSIPKDGPKDKKKDDDASEPAEEGIPSEDEAAPDEDGQDLGLDPNAVDDGTGDVGPDGLPMNPDDELNGIGGEFDDPTAGLEPDPVINDMRDIKLYDLMSALESYVQYFIKAISNIDQSQLNSDQNVKLIKYHNDMKKDLDDIKFYLQNDYENNEYQKNLYAYLLFNKSLAQTVLHVRSVLSLKADDLKTDDEDGKKQS